MGDMTSTIVHEDLRPAQADVGLYTPSLPFFVGLALILGLIFGALMQRSGNQLPAVLFHAGSDTPIFLVYLSFTLT